VHTIVVLDFLLDGTGTYTVTLTGPSSVCDCTFTLTPPSRAFSQAGGTDTVSVATGAACHWTAQSEVSWAVLTSGGSSTGTGSVGYTVAPNTGTARTGFLTIAGQSFRIDQSDQTGTFTRYLAEGATGAFFDMSVALLNLDPVPAAVTLRFLKDDGTVVTQGLTVNGTSRATVNPELIPGLELASFSTVIESTLPVVVDRTMTWTSQGYGSHAETSVASPSTTWYLAEGSTSSDFTLFYLLQNPNNASLTATVTYLLPGGLPPITRTYNLPANSRTTIPVDMQGPELASTDVSAIVTSPQPIIVERAMYLNVADQPFAAGHDSVGVTAPALEWFLAEGATGPFFELFVLVANPNAAAAEITVDYLLPNGTVLAKSYTVAGNGRFTIWVDEEEIPANSGVKPLANVPVSMAVRSTNGVPVIVERAMWWPQPVWHEAHNSPGATSAGTRWALADGELGGPRGHETYILVANTSSFAGQARVTLFFEDGTTMERTFALVANSRTNVQVSLEFLAAQGRRFGALVESLGSVPAQIVVERAMYSNAGGVVWAAGTNVLATRLQ
jgi:hypothetical protein